MNEKTLKFRSSDLTLEGVLHLPRNTPAIGGVVVCHPHPLYGGDMDNNVVRDICVGLEHAGIGALRFNFRGVGGSEGGFANGIGELEDAASAVSFLSSMAGLEGKQLGLCGYSFGAGVAFYLSCRDERVSAVACVSMPLPPTGALGCRPIPKLLATGSKYLLTPARVIEVFARAIPEPKQYVIVPGADHFWRDHEDELTRTVVAFFLKAFQDQTLRTETTV